MIVTRFYVRSVVLAQAVRFRIAVYRNSHVHCQVCSSIPRSRPPRRYVLGVASALRIEINRALVIRRSIALGKDLKKFLAVIAGLWVLSILGSCWNFLTLLYTGFILLHTVPYIYDKYEDKVDAFGEKAEAEIKKQYAVFNVKVLSKIPVGALKQKFA
ncbi:hypothetical protein R6Q59_035666 [Mikania micrantha]